MSQNKHLLQLIKALTDPEFDRVALLYVSEVDGVEHVINCNGPYDGGLDMRSAEIGQIDAQYQITTREKRFEVKLNEDLAKASDNVKKFKLPKKVKYFYSYPLTPQVIIALKKEAKDKYGLILELIEASTIAGIAEKYDQIRNLLYDLGKVPNFSGNSKFFEDSKVKAFYDLMSFGTSTDIKYNILKSYVLNYLHEFGSTSSNELLTKLNKHFDSKFTSSYFEGICKRMNSEKKIQLSGYDKLELTIGEKQRIYELLEKYKVEEALLRKEITDLLTEYDLAGVTENVILKLSVLYESNYSINLGEFSKKNATINDLRTATKQFHRYVQGLIKDKRKADTLAKRLFEIADDNEILSRIAAGQAYSKVSDPDRLQEYIIHHHNNKDIFLDTNVMINAVCVFYNPESHFSDPHFKVAKQFLDFAEKNHLNLKTLQGYAVETINLFKEALEIVPFTKLPFFESLGGTRNTFYNYFKFLKDHGELTENTTTFEEFLEEFGFDLKKHRSGFSFKPQMEHLLEYLGIEVELPPVYEGEKIFNVKAIINEDLRDHRKTKSALAISYDAIAILRLGDADVEINPVDPIFCTWDMSLWRIRKRFFENYPSSTKFLIYTPTRLMDHYSMMNFQVKSGTLSNEVLSILEEDFGFQERTHSLLDSMLTIINPENKVGLRYATELNELRQRETLQVDHKPEGIAEENQESNSVDVLFRKLFVNYATKVEEGIFDVFKKIFTKEEMFKDVFGLLSNEVKVVHSTGDVSNELFSKMDILIERSVKEEKK